MSQDRIVGFVGLGRMGTGLAQRAHVHGFTVAGCDPDPTVRKQSQVAGIDAFATIDELVAHLPAPRTIWVMVPAGKPTDDVIDTLISKLSAGDTVIDGGNSYYRDDIRHSVEAHKRGIHFLDVGTSGGVWGAERGFCLMIGGEAEAVSRLIPLWQALSPGIAGAERTDPDRPVSSAEEGWLHCGPSGAGHFVKMVHNGIEYGLMAAYAEGLNILKHADAGAHAKDADAETAPLGSAEFYQYSFDVPQIAEVWRRGSVVTSWLLDLTAQALAQDPELSDFAGRVSDSGEGRWTAIAAIEEGVPAPVLTAALLDRFSSQGSGTYAHQILSAMRAGFGGHLEK